MGLLSEPWQREYRTMWRREQRFLRACSAPPRDPLGRLLEEKVPEDLTRLLCGAFGKAFSLVFEKGGGVIRWAGRQTRREADYQVRCCAASLRRDRRSLRAFSGAAAAAGRGSVLQAGIQGMGLGLLGIGLPDVLLFTVTLLKGVRETAVSFGFFQDSPRERLFTLRLIAAALSHGAELERRNAALNRFIQDGEWPEEPDLPAQLRETSELLARSMLHWKFLQGIPVAGAAGGAWDAVCLRRVQRYALLKYQRRFLIGWKQTQQETR